MGRQGEDQARWAPPHRPPPLPTHLGSPEKPNGGNPQGWGVGQGQPLLRPRAPPPTPASTKGADLPSPAPAIPSSPGRHHPPGLSDLDLCPREVLGTQGPSTRPHPPPPVTQGCGSVVLRHRVVSRGGCGGQDTGQPPHSLEPPLAWEGVDSGHRDAGAGSRPQGCGRSEVATQGCGPGPRPPCLAGLAPRRLLAPGPAGLAVSPSACLLGQVLGGAPRQVQPLCPAGSPPPLPPVTFLSPRTMGSPLGSPQWGLCNWGLTALVSQGDVMIRRPGG